MAAHSWPIMYPQATTAPKKVSTGYCGSNWMVGSYNYQKFILWQGRSRDPESHQWSLKAHGCLQLADNASTSHHFSKKGEYGLLWFKLDGG